MNTEIFKERGTIKHDGRYGYLRTEYKGAKEKVIITCEKHGDFLQRPSHHLDGRGCPKCYFAGISRASTQEEKNEVFAAKSIVVHGPKYGYNLVKYVDSKTPVTIVCPEHGEFQQLPTNHLAGRGCRKCHSALMSSDNEQFKIDAAKVHWPVVYNYSLVEYKHSHDKVRIICEEHGEFMQSPTNHLSGNGCPSCANHTSKYERDLSRFVKSLGLKVEDGRRDIVGDGKEIDIFIPSKNIAIEFNGLYWHSEVYGRKDAEYHLNKTQPLAEKGIRLIHIFEDEWIHKQEIVKTIIKNALISERREILIEDCEIRDIDLETKNQFLINNHIQGPDSARSALGAYYKGLLAAIMTFNENPDGAVEISRFSEIHEVKIVNVAGELLQFYERINNPHEVIVVVDKRWGGEELYENIGFTKSHDTPPDYWYFKFKLKPADANFMRRMRITDFEKEFSEKMGDKNVDRICDCGTVVLTKKFKLN